MPPVCSQRTPCCRRLFLKSIMPGFMLAGGGVAAVVHRDAGAHAGADFGEVQADAVGAADAVVLGHDDVAHVHADRAAVVDDRSGRPGCRPAG